MLYVGGGTMSWSWLGGGSREYPGPGPGQGTPPPPPSPMNRILSQKWDEIKYDIKITFTRTFLKRIGGHESFLWGHWYPCFGLPVTHTRTCSSSKFWYFHYILGSGERHWNAPRRTFFLNRVDETRIEPKTPSSKGIKRNTWNSTCKST